MSLEPRILGWRMSFSDLPAPAEGQRFEHGTQKPVE